MFDKNYGAVKSVSWLDAGNKVLIQTFLKGAVYSWCNNNLDEDGKQTWFSARKFLGDKNRMWAGTPLFILYEHHRYVLGKSEDDAVDQAGKEAGMLLKDLLKRDRRSFESRPGYMTREYRWIVKG